MPFITRDTSLYTKPINGLFAVRQFEDQEFLDELDPEVVAFVDSQPEPGQPAKPAGGLFARGGL